jgi:hypothetical protein
MYVVGCRKVQKVYMLLGAGKCRNNKIFLKFWVRDEYEKEQYAVERGY